MRPTGLAPGRLKSSNDKAGATDGADERIISLGCRLNRYESGVMARHVEAAGLGDVRIVNSCAVTAEAVRQSRQALRRLRRRHPAATLIATGCAAQIAPRQFAAMKEVDVVLGNREKLRAQSFYALRASGASRLQVGDIMTAPPEREARQPIPDFPERVRAFLQVQNGCDHRCTFCVIPYGRGNSRSLPPAEVLRRARALTERGFAEITLTGVDLTAYGLDLSPAMRLGDLLARLLAEVPQARRLRLSSLDPVEIDSLTLELLASEERLLPHVHLSLQSGDDLILKRMKRRHSRADAMELCHGLRKRRGDIVFGADLIAGFPTESEEMFRQTESLVAECDLTWLHVFAYSPRPGTPAARMPAVAATEIRSRARRLRALGSAAAQRYGENLVGTCQEILVESPSRGRSRHYAQAHIRGGGAIVGELARLQVEGARDGILLGTLRA